MPPVGARVLRATAVTNKFDHEAELANVQELHRHAKINDHRRGKPQVSPTFDVTDLRYKLPAMQDWQAPTGHPISMDRAKELMAGDLADAYRSILCTSCAPIFWYRRDREDLSILHNGTVTFVQTPECLLGITAAHVLQQYLRDSEATDVRLQIADATVDDMRVRIVDISARLDLATFKVDPSLLAGLGKEITPLSNWPPSAPQEGRGIMLAGFPAIERLTESNLVNFGLFTALVISRTVTDVQITWLIEPEAQLADAKLPPPPPKYGLGGVSGGPLIALLESESHVTTFALGGIITEHPDYEIGDFWIERVVAVRADFISANGRIKAN